MREIKLLLDILRDIVVPKYRSYIPSVTFHKSSSRDAFRLAHRLELTLPLASIDTRRTAFSIVPR